MNEEWNWQKRRAFFNFKSFCRLAKFPYDCRLLLGRSQVGVTASCGYIYAVGGCQTWNCLNTVERYDPVLDSWSYVSSLATCRRGCGVTEFNGKSRFPHLAINTRTAGLITYDSILWLGKLHAVGGSDGSSCLFTCEVYDEEQNVWKFGPNLTSSRANVGVAVIDNCLYAVGGFSGKSFLNTIEFLDSETNEWTTFIPKEKIVDDRSSC